MLPRLHLTIGILAIAATSAGARGEEPGPRPNDTITIAMKDAQAKRPGRIRPGLGGVLGLILKGGPPDEALAKRGTIEVDGETFALYLPGAAHSPIKNTGKSNDHNENTSTRISIDQDGNGEITEEEGWFANLPIRIGDRMFEVIEIAADGSRIVVKRSQAPLRGLIVGRRCPDFAFKTADGREVSLASLRGKAFLLDIWSVT